MWLNLLSICVFVGIRGLDARSSQGLYGNPPVITALTEEISSQGNVTSRKYQYYKFTFSYNESQSRSYKGVSDSSSITAGIDSPSSHPGQKINVIKRGSDGAVGDPYDPSDPLKNSISIDLESLSGDADMFVSCSLELAGDDVLTPSSSVGHFNFSSRHFDVDVLTISAGDKLNCARSGHTGVFYIAVYGNSFEASSYAITVSRHEGVRIVEAGLPIFGKVFAGSGYWYKFQLPDKSAQQITIALVSSKGDADLYVKLGVPISQIHAEISGNLLSDTSADGPYIPAGRVTYDFKSSHIGNSDETIVIPESSMAKCAAASCWVSILVDGYSSATYTLLISLEDTDIQLLENVPQYSSVIKGSIQYFKMPVTGGYISSVVTVFNGDPVLYMSKMSLMPNANAIPETAHDNGVFTGGIPTVHFVMQEIPDLQTIYLAVGNASVDCDFTIRCSAQKEAGPGMGMPPVVLHQLLEGVPQSDVITTTSSSYSHRPFWEFYYLQVEAGHETLRVQMMGIVGRLNIYAVKGDVNGEGALPNATHFLVKGDAQQGMDILRNDDAACSYVIALESMSSFATYTLAVTLADKILELESGVSVTDSVDVGEFDYFSFTPTGSRVVYINLEVEHGDADLFVSTTHIHPNLDNSTWRSTGYGSDQILIASSDPNACHNIHSLSHSHSHSPSVITLDATTGSSLGTITASINCRYYISVKGIKKSAYSVVASTDMDTIALLDGYEVTSSNPNITAHKKYSFLYTYGTTSYVSIEYATSSYSGLARVHVGIPSPHMDFQYSLGYPSSKITVNQRLPIFSPCTLGPCVVSVTVYGEGSSSLTVSTGYAIRPLKWGVSVEGILEQDQPENWGAPVTEADVPFDTLILGSGQFQIFIACTAVGSSFRPNSSHHSFASDIKDRDKVLRISSQQAQAAGCFVGEKTMLVTLLSGVSSTPYSLTTSRSNFTNDFSTLMIAGMSISATVIDQTFQYYSIVPGNALGSLRISASVNSGGIDMYVSAYWNLRAVRVGGVVKSFNYSSKATAGIIGQSIVISPTEISRMCKTRTNCKLVLGVCRSSQSASAAAAAAERNQLSDGASGHVGARSGTDTAPIAATDATLDHPLSESEVDSGDAAQTISTSTYTVVFNMESSITELSDSIPVAGTCSGSTGSYYRYRIIAPDTDLSISVTSFYGDADIFVSLAPVIHPTRYNYTWVAASQGSDSLTLQPSMLAPYCIPNPATGKTCDIYIGLHSWQNASYTVVASLTNGFESRIMLQDGIPQTGSALAGQYRYFEYYVMGGGGSSGLRFTLTNYDVCDLDLYITFKNSSSAAKNAPGIDNWDISSAHIGTVGEEINVLPSDLHYCRDCTVYIAVLVYRTPFSLQPEFTLTATSGFLETLQLGRVAFGRVRKALYRYYIFRVDDSLASITIRLQCFDGGDADLFVSVLDTNSTRALSLPSVEGLRGTEGYSDTILNLKQVEGKPFALPTKESSTWHSSAFGGDTVLIQYYDPNFCGHCSYVVGVRGFYNSSYGIVATAAKDEISRLVPGTAWEVTGSPNKLEMFSVGVQSSSALVTVTVTSLDNSNQDIYIKVLKNDSALSRPSALNISDARTYTYTSKDSLISEISVPGPHMAGTVFLIAVDTYYGYTQKNDPQGQPGNMKTLTQLKSLRTATTLPTSSPSLSAANITSRYTILASYSQQHVLLVSGLPQNHFMVKGGMVFFQFIPQDGYDLRISVTARSGDPDLLVSSDYAFPNCGRQENPSGAVHMKCDNFTWASKQYSSDQIIISREFPCKAMLPSTKVNDNCNPLTSYQPKIGKPVNIGVYGYYRNTAFTIVAGPGGGTSQLTEGTPALFSTSPSYECSLYNEDSGACIRTNGDVRSLAAYFSFKTEGSILQSNRSVEQQLLVFTVEPQCITSSSVSSFSFSSDAADPESSCYPGCECNPFTAFLTSCETGKCRAEDRRPSTFSAENIASFQVSSTGTSYTLAIPVHSSSVRSGALDYESSPRACIPAAGVSCEFYMAVIAQRYDAQAVTSEFIVTVKTPLAVTLVPCEDAGQVDGIRTLAVEEAHALPGTTLNRYYDVCTSSKVRTVGGLDQPIQHLTVSLDQCSGSTTLLACDVDPTSGVSHCPRSKPTPTDWAYMSDGNQTCTRHWEKEHNKWGKQVCTPQPKTHNMPSLLLPFNDSSADAENYIVLAVGEGDFQMKVHSRDTIRLYQNQGADISPSVVTLKPSELLITWHPSQLRWPNGTLLKVDPQHPISYSAVIIDAQSRPVSNSDSDFSAHLQSECGLQYAMRNLPPGAVRSQGLQPIDHQQSLAFTFNDAQLFSHREVFIVIVATCDAACLRAAAMKSDPKSACAGHTFDCSKQVLVYPHMRVALPPLPPKGNSAFGEVIIFTFWVVVTALLLMFVVGVILMHDKGLFSDAAQGLGFGDRDSALSTPYTDSLGEETRGGWGPRGWGYAQLHFTEMVDTSTFSGSRGQDGEGESGQGETQGVPRSSRGAAIAGEGRRVLGSVLDGASVVLGNLASFITSTAGTASAALSRYEAVPRESTDIDNSNQPPRQKERNGGYRPPSPVSSPIVDFSATKIRKDSGLESESIAMINIHQSADEEKDRDRGKEVRDASQTYVSLHPHTDESDEGL